MITFGSWHQSTTFHSCTKPKTKVFIIFWVQLLRCTTEWIFIMNHVQNDSKKFHQIVMSIIATTARGGIQIVHIGMWSKR